MKKEVEEGEDRKLSLMSYINALLFTGMPESYPFHKKLNLLLNSSSFGYYWDLLLVTTAIIACGLYVSETYTDNIYLAVHVYFILDTIITSIFTADFLLRLVSSYSYIRFLFSPWTIIDAITILPYYIELGHATLAFNYSSIRFLRIFRLLRLVRVFRLLRTVQGISKQVAMVAITFICFVFVGAGIEQIMENDVKQFMSYQCLYIGPDTNWLPSCDAHAVASDSCDCFINDCQSFYNRFDVAGQPTGVKCVSLTFFDSFYFLIVTVGTLGYGDIFPTTELSRLVIVVVILSSLVVIPIQVEKLGRIIRTTSLYRRPFKRLKKQAHVIVCGCLDQREKVERFLVEFYHPSKILIRHQDICVLLLAPSEPSEDIKGRTDDP